MKPTVLPLLDYIQALSPRFKSPAHLAPLAEALERSEREPVHVVASVPPRHGKTELLKHGIVRRLRKRPHTRVAYVTYAASFAQKKSREIRQLYARSGGTVVEDANTLADWRTTSTGTDDGGLWATSVGGPITGEGFDLIIIDDSVKSRALAESGVEREKLIDWYRDTLSTREEPGASTFIIGARWTPHDLAGMLIADGWKHVNLPAVSDEGKALWPARYDLPALEQIKATLGEYGWSSLYMGRPFPRGGAVFHDSFFFDGELPTGIVVTIGIDLAYSRKAKADYSVAVVLGKSGDRYFVLDVVRVQVEAPAFIKMLATLKAKWGHCNVTGYFGGTERGVVDIMKDMGLSIDAKTATLDKFTRAQPVAAAWNGGRVLLPRKAPWLDAFVAEVVSFTGDDKRDDQVDALAGAFDAMTVREPALLVYYERLVGGAYSTSSVEPLPEAAACVDMVVSERFLGSSHVSARSGRGYSVVNGHVFVSPSDVESLCAPPLSFTLARPA